MTKIIQEITLGASSSPDGKNTTAEHLKILVMSVSDELTEVLTLSRKQLENQASQKLFNEGEWRVVEFLGVPLSFTHRCLVKLLLSLVASHIKSGHVLMGNYVYEDLYPVDIKRGKPPRSNQGQRLKGHTSVYEVAQHFHRPINEASRRLNICPTVLKKICRKAGLPRWPHRKLQSIHRELDKLRMLLDDNTQTEAQLQGLQGRISHLERERRLLCFEEDYIA